MNILFLLALFISSPVMALSADKEADKRAIKSMVGCYDVTFQSKETFAFSRDYQFYPAYASGALEWIFVDEESDDKIVLQHLLITPGGIVKHWRQDWLFENEELLEFQGDNHWQKRQLDTASVAGQWTQQVFQVDDSPRYECSAPWIRWGSKEFWECEAPTPLPRREFSVRSDYNILMRENRHEVSGSKWVHDQDNVKVKRSNGVDQKIAMEKTINTYIKTADLKCQSAITWWQDHAPFWRTVRAVWDDVRTGRDEMIFKSSLNGMNLWMTLFELDERALNENWTPERIRTESRAAIESFL